MAALLMLAAGVLNLGSALLPAEHQRLDLLHRLVSGGLSKAATVVTAAAGIGLLLLAGGLRLRRRTAWLVAVVLLGGSAVLHLLKGLDFEEAVAEAFLAGLLAGQGSRFTARARPTERRAAAVAGLGCCRDHSRLVADVGPAAITPQQAPWLVAIATPWAVWWRDA